MKIFKSHPGVGNIIAWEFRAEMLDVTRFSQPKQVSKYLDLCPRISQSGNTCRYGPIAASFEFEDDSAGADLACW